MGTIAEKLTYLNTTKTMLKDSLNKFGSSILSTDTFRSYDTKLNEIYDKLPKVTQSGAGFTLSNVQNGQVDDFKMIGVDLEQDTTTGKNLLNISDITSGNGIKNNNNKSITLNGNITSTSFTLTNPITLKANATYIMSLTNNDTNAGDSTFILRNGNTNKMSIYFKNLVSNAPFTPTEDIIIDTLRIYNSGVTFNNYTFSIQLEEGSSSTSFEPYTGGIPSPNPDYPQEIKVVEGRQVVTDKGKNLFNFGIRSRNQNGITTNYNFSQAIINGTTTTNNSIVGFSTKISEYSISLGTYSAGSYVFKFEKVSGNLTYPSGASEIHIRNSNDTTIFKNKVNSETTNYTKSFTLEQETELFIQWFVNESNWTFTDYICRFMIISDTDSATDYEPYYEPSSYNIDLQLENIYLAKMPNTDYKNRIYKNNGNWYFEENAKKVVLDGSEEWTHWTNQELTNTILVGTKIIDNISNVAYIGMSNYFENSSTSIWTTDEQKMQINSTGENKIRFRINKTIANNYNSFKTWLSTHNVIVWYSLATSVTTQITNTTLINQLEAISVHTGTNIITISNSNNIIPEIEITRLKELEKLA